MKENVSEDGVADKMIGSQGEEIDEIRNKNEPYPKRIFFIIGMEFCERFSYYGMRTILVLYARNYLLFDDDSSTAVFHAFTLLAYLTPLFGGILADSYSGKYKAIAYLSVVYIMGHVLKTIAAIPYIPSSAAHISLSMAGLLLIAIGTGGIKPCVSSFGGDQFTAAQVQQTSQYFSMFYFSINLGALLSKWITPIFRADLDCYPGEDEPQFQECFSVAFGIPGFLMLVALAIFLLGSSFYTYVQPEGSVFWKFCKCVWSAGKNFWIKSRKKIKEKQLTAKSKQHWINYADAPVQMKKDTIAVLKVLFLFLPLPFFWALFDQQGSRWTLQALQLDGYWGNYLVKPEQIDVINPLLIVTLIPLFEVTLYPLLRRCKVDFNPLRRMTAGLVLAGLSFVCASILQFEIDKRITVFPVSDQFSLRIINVSPRTINIQSSSDVFNGTEIPPYGVNDKKSVFFNGNTSISLNYEAIDGSSVVYDITNRNGQATDVILGSEIGYDPLLANIPRRKLENGSAIVSFINVDYPGNISVETKDFSLNSPVGERSVYTAVPRGKTDYIVYLTEDDSEKKAILNGTIYADPGGGYTVIFHKDPKNPNRLAVVEFNDDVKQLLDFNPNNINIAWMIPQYFIITVGEVFLSVTGLEFSYTQAPKSMKSVVSSFWLLTVSMGNVIVLLIAKTKAIHRQAHEFLLFAGLIGIAAIVFGFMAKRHTPINEEEKQEPELESNEDQLLTTEI